MNFNWLSSGFDRDDRPPPPTTTHHRRHHLLPPPRFARRSANDLKINLKMLSKSFKIDSKIVSKSIQKLIQNRLKNWYKIDSKWSDLSSIRGLVWARSGGLLGAPIGASKRGSKSEHLCSGITTFGNLVWHWNGKRRTVGNLQWTYRIMQYQT